MTAGSIIPATSEAQATPNGRLPFGFTPRFLVALLLGLLLLIPAWWSRQFVAVMFAWDGFIFTLWVVDLLRLPSPAKVKIEREWLEPLSLGRFSSARIHVHNESGLPLHGSFVDETPTALRDEPPSVDFRIPADDVAQEEYTVKPRVRGDSSLGRLFLRYRSPLGLAERWAITPIAQAVRVMPDLVRARNYALYLIRSRQVDMEKRRKRQRGIGREFEALREYRQGDEMRTVYWPATARRHELITRTFQVERSQAVWIVLDSGRLLQTQVYDPVREIFVSKLDYAVDAALALAQVAVQSGDRVGLVAYGRELQESVGLGRGPQHLRTVLDALSKVRVESSEADHALAARTLLRLQSQRCLIVWITDFAETATTPEVIEHATLMTRRHLVLFASISQPDLKGLLKWVPQTEQYMFRYAAALEVAERRERLLRRLREQGVLAIDMEPGTLTDAVLNQYLEIKDRSLL